MANKYFQTCAGAGTEGRDYEPILNCAFCSCCDKLIKVKADGTLRAHGLYV